jgi:chorismate mutase
MRASIYNAVSLEGVQALVDFHERFRQTQRLNPMSDDLQKALAGVRAEIDGIDGELLRLLNQRAVVPRRLAKSRPNTVRPGTSTAPSVKRRCCADCRMPTQGPLPGENITFFFREVMSACLSLEEPLGIAFSARSVPSPAVRRPSISAMPPVYCRSRRLTMFFAKSNPATPITPSCRSKTRPKARSADRWTCCWRRH